MITEAHITAILLQRNSGVEGGLRRIKEFYKNEPDAMKRRAFLKKEFGIGGCYPALLYADISEDHDAKGITLKYGGIIDPEEVRLLTWDEVTGRYNHLFETGVINLTYDSMKLYRIINTLK